MDEFKDYTCAPGDYDERIDAQRYENIENAGRDIQSSGFLSDMFAAKGHIGLPNIASAEHEVTMKDLPF